MEEIQTGRYERQWRRLNWLAIICVMLFYIALLFMPGRMQLFKTTYFRALEAAMAAFMLFFFRRKAGAELKLLYAYVAWLFVTRLLNNDYYLQYDIDIVLDNLLCAVLFATAAALPRTERERLLRSVLGLVLLYCTVLSVLSVLNLCVGSQILLPFDGAHLGRQAGSGARFNFLFSAPTQSGMWFVYSSFAALYFFAVYKRPLIRALLAADIILMNSVIGLLYSYCSMLSYCVAAAMLALLLGRRWLKLKNRALRASLLVLITAAALPLTYYSFSLTRGAAEKLEETLYLQRIPESESGLEAETAQTGSSDSSGEMKVYENRKLTQKASSLGNRIEIWTSCFEALKYDPSVFIKGDNNLTLMYGTNYILRHRWIAEAEAEGRGLGDLENVVMINHHNAYLQLFMLTGIPGALIVLAFLILLIRRMLMAYFAPFERVSMQTKLLTLPLAAMLVYSFVECGLFGDVDIRVVQFFILAGVFVANTNEDETSQLA